jgi:flagellar hook-associated protein 2
MSSSLSVAGLASDFDWKSFVDQIMQVEHAPVDRLATEKSDNSKKATLLSTLGGKLSVLQTSAQALNSVALFGKRSTSLTSASSGTLWSASAATDTAVGTYKIAVSQLATAANLKGANDVGSGLNSTTDDVSGLTLANLPIAQAVTAGTFTVNGKQVTVALTDSLQNVFDAISTATGGSVTASYDHTTDKITLTSTSGEVMLGAANDTSNFLRAVKLGNNGTNTVTSSGKLGTVKTSATLNNANLSTAVTAVDGNGAGSFTINGVAISYNVGTDTLSSVLKRINDSDAGVSASYDGVNDRVVLENKSTGDLGISVTESAGGLLGALGLTSGTTFTRGKNAEFTVNGGDVLTSASNTLDASAHGVTGLSVTATSTDTQTITIAADTSAMRDKIKDFIDKFNDVQSYIDTNTKISTDAKGKVTAAALASNREVQEWSRSLRSLAFEAVSGITGSIDRLDDLGIDFKSGTSELEIVDSSKLDAALANSTTDVDAFFTTATTGFAAKLDTFVGNIEDQNKDQQDHLNQANTSLDSQMETLERRLAQQRELMESAFIKMETAQSKIKQQQSAISSLSASSSKSS